MGDDVLTQEGQCQCGSTKFTIQNKALVRIFCHCTICQEFNNATFGDVSIFLSKDVHLHDREKVNFRKYKSPPAVQRGKCAACNKPAIEFLDLPLFPSLTIIPSANIPAGQFVPPPSIHTFYHRRLADINDTLPKKSGFIKSQLALIAILLPSLFRRFTS
jgi:hypothetical protein